MPRKTSLSVEERRLKERERKKVYRQNLSQEQKEVIRQRDREWRLKKREENPISSLSEKQKEILRKEQCARQRIYRERKQKLNDSSNCSVQVSCKERGRKKVKRDQSSGYRKINKLTRKCDALETKCESLRKKIYRLKKKKLTNSPMSKVQHMIVEAHGKLTFNIQKKLLLGEVFLSQLRKKYAEKSIEQKQNVSEILCNSYIKKYKLCGTVRDIVGRKFIRNGKKVQSFKSKMCISLREGEKVRKFFEEDENSRMCPGKKDHKKNIQKRFLLDSITDLHKKYCERHSSKISLKTFQRLKPF